MDVLTGKVVPGRRVAIIGAGGIGFDVADFLTHEFNARDSALRFESVRNDEMTILSSAVDKVRFARFTPHAYFYCISCFSAPWVISCRHGGSIKMLSTQVASFASPHAKLSQGRYGLLFCSILSYYNTSI